MKEDYLWNRTGSDPEIEWLETSLRGFAHKQTPPEIPASQPAIALTGSRSIFGLGFGFAAGCMAATVFGVFMIPVSRQSDSTAARIPTLPVVEGPARSNVFAVKPVPRPAVLRDTKPAASRPQVQKAAANMTAAKPVRPQKLVLTQEEADAYRKLMTALSIASSNLKIVKDKLAGSENGSTLE